MVKIRKHFERGHAEHGWLDTSHSFSFADYYDPEQMGFSSLRVINDDRIAPGAGFPTHAHRDMEIITYVLQGTLEHRDSMGNGSIIRPGDVQRMSAGSGVTHSEFNASTVEPVHLLQIWIMPDRQGIPPGYEQKSFSVEEKRGKCCLIASPDGAEKSLTIHQNARVYTILLDHDHPASYRLPPGRRAYLHMAHGAALVNGAALEAGDGARIEDESVIRLESDSAGEGLLFDLA